MCNSIHNLYSINTFTHFALIHLFTNTNASLAMCQNQHVLLVQYFCRFALAVAATAGGDGAADTGAHTYFLITFQ